MFEDRLLRIKQVLEIVPVSKSTWINGVREGKFPKGRKLTERTTVWLLSEIQEVVAQVANGKGIA